MSFRIVSGKGNGKEATVDDTGRLVTRAITQSESDIATDEQQRYNINTGNITLTSATASAVLYFKNNENYDFEINSFIYAFGPSTGGTGAALVDVIFKPTAGTIVSGASAVAVNQNLNLGSANVLSALVYKGAEGNTITDGVTGISSLLSVSSRSVIALGKLVIPKGQSVAVRVTPPTGNTSLILQVAISGYVATPAVFGGIK